MGSVLLTKRDYFRVRGYSTDLNETVEPWSMVLSAEGFQATAAFSAPQALKLLQTESFDLLLSHVMMPGMTGIELAIDVSRRVIVRAVLLMSGVASTADLLENAKKLDGYNFDILAKPVYPTEVIGKIEQTLA